MGSRDFIRIKLMENLGEYRVLNTVELCRLVNNREKRDVKFCYEGQKFNYESRNWNDLCNHPNCSIRYKVVWACLKILEKRKMVQSQKMRFKDSTTKRKGKSTDIFRFWFIDPEDFKNIILQQTLIPYLDSSIDLSKIL